MKTLLNPRWLILINTIPIIILFALFLGTYDVIGSLLSEETLKVWINFGSALGLLWFATLSYSIYSILKKRKIGIAYAAITLISYISLIYMDWVFGSDLIPWDIPRWMLPEDFVLYPTTFLMPTLAHALFALMINLTRENQKPWISFGTAILIPVCWYVFLMILLPMWQPLDYRFSEHVIAVLLIAGTVVFLFFLGRGVYIIFQNRKSSMLENPAAALIVKAVIGLVLPVLGLHVNEYYFHHEFFGDFSSYWFFAIAVVNGILICIPDLENKNLRLILFLLRVITFGYVIYFFFVFLPYLPLSVLAIIAIGAGFLMLTPIVLFILQCQILNDDMKFLFQYFSKKIITVGFALTLCVLPLILTAVYYSDKATLYKALDHVYEGNLEQDDESVSSNGLRRVLDAVEQHRSRSSNTRQIPFLSSYYNWLVLDNLTLSQDKTKLLEKIFYGNVTPFEMTRDRDDVPVAGFDLRKASVSSTFDAKQQAWISQIDFEIKNKNLSIAEFATTFNLPQGAWINDYYLMIEGEKVSGILAEKKAATWIYQQIRDYRRDPGILYYLEGNEIALRIFPFAGSEIRTAGFQIIHKEPIQFDFFGKHIAAGNASVKTLKEIYSSDGNTVYVSKNVKANLPEIKRSPEYHFIIDCSKASEQQITTYTDRIKKYLTENKINATNAHYVLTNSITKRVDNIVGVSDLRNVISFKGGFFLERAIEKILYDAYYHPKPNYPVIVVVTDYWADAIVTKGFADLSVALPESDLFFQLSNDSMIAHSLVNNPLQPYKSAAVNYPVVAWPDKTQPQRYLRKNEEASIFTIAGNKSDLVKSGKQNDWDAGLALQGSWLNHKLHPEKADEDWLALVRASFTAHTMTPVTSFISVENEAQRQALLKKQEQVLNADSSLDIGNESRMSEPGLFLVLGLFVILLIIRRKFL